MKVLRQIICLIGSIILLFILLQIHLAYMFLSFMTLFAGSISSILLGGGGMGLHTLGIDILRTIFKGFRIILYFNLSQSERDDLDRSRKELNIIDDLKATFAPGNISFICGILTMIFIFLGFIDS